MRGNAPHVPRRHPVSRRVPKSPLANPLAERAGSGREMTRARLPSSITKEAGRPLPSPWCRRSSGPQRRPSPSGRDRLGFPSASAGRSWAHEAPWVPFLWEGMPSGSKHSTPRGAAPPVQRHALEEIRNHPRQGASTAHFGREVGILTAREPDLERYSRNHRKLWRQREDRQTPVSPTKAPGAIH